MGGLWAIFRRAKKRPRAACNPSDRPEKTSSDPALSELRPRLQAEHYESPSEEPPPDSFPDGVEVLYDCPDATVDICFVHGLTGNRNSTWTHHKQSVPWPKILLPSELAKASILTYGYDAYVVRKSGTSSNRLIDHAANLLNDLTTDRASRSASSRPLIFVAHSLGGLVCKEAILLSRNHPESHLRGIFEFIKGIAFMGTPHRGSWMADWAKIPASALGIVGFTNKRLLEILETDSQLLESIQVRFLSTIRELREAGRRLEITCFFEELPLPVIGKVVSKESAALQGYSTFSIHANHRDMVRFASTKDSGFGRLLGELIRWQSQIKETAICSSTPPAGEEQIGKLSGLSFNNCGSGTQFNAPGGAQNTNMGSGNQLFGEFNGPVYFR